MYNNVHCGHWSLWFVAQMTGTRQKKVGRLLDTIPTRGDNAFPALIKALVLTQQEHLAEILDPEGVTEVDHGNHSHEDTRPQAKDKPIEQKVFEIRTF